jgi:DNA-binding GntR family transcriptional regulator
MLQKRDPLFLQAYEVIKDKILRGALVPGERLVESTLARDLGVSRNPIREALRLLMQDGLIHSSSNGHIVHPLTIDDIKEIYECRMMVEPFAGALAAQRASKKEVHKLNKFIEQAQSSYEEGNFNKTIEANSNFHRSIVLLCQNKSILNIFSTIENLVVMSRYIEMKINQRPLDYLGQHLEMVRLIEAGESSKIKTLIEEHINIDWTFFKECSLQKAL